MKIQTAILALGCISAMAQDSLTSSGNFLGTSPAALAAPNPNKIENERAKAEYNFIPKDLWREVGGQTNYAKGEGWVQFTGEIVAVKPYGIWVKGGYGKPPFNRDFYNQEGLEFFVKNYSYQSAYGDILLSSKNLTAKESGVFTFTNTTGGTTTLHQLDYGVPCGVPAWFIEQQKKQADAAQAALEAQKKKAFELQKHAVEWLLSQATNGSASAQCSLGIHYLNGQGVETNKETAVYWLTQAANQGNIEASNALEKLK